MKIPFWAVLCLCAQSALAQDVLILGEVHDNPQHHNIQAERVKDFEPAAIVFEMLTEAKADLYDKGLLSDSDALERALGWANSGWPDFNMYYPIFVAAGEAQVFGAAVPREKARQAMQQGLEVVFPDAEKFGLTIPLPKGQQEQREALQHAAHCAALPKEMLPAMVEIQRLRDAALARAVLEALDTTGGPVAVITGNGHARKDWGVPKVLEHIAPDLEVYAVGQTEDGAALKGEFDEIVSSPGIAREDPCAAFQ